MSTKKEQAYIIIEQLSDERLKEFVSKYSRLLPAKTAHNQLSKEEAFTAMQKLKRSIPDLDEKKEIEEYRAKKHEL